MADHDESMFPRGLFSWSGHREGGVKKPFNSASGRPTGQVVETPLVARLSSWAKLVASGATDGPMAIILVGGPGNGKTDAVEVAVERLDAELQAGGRLTAAFTSAYAAPDGRPAPRKVSVDLERIGVAGVPRAARQMRLVQDATERDPSRPDLSPAALLVEDLQGLAMGEASGIFICCANRGIVSEAITAAKRDPEKSSACTLLTAILEAVTSGPKAMPCWPLREFRRIAVWPMDIESLVDSRAGESSAHQIFRAALDAGRWEGSCEAGRDCPFCSSRKALTEPATLTSLIRLLRFYEQGSGKRWTFRDLYSLVAYLLAGLEDEYGGATAGVSPCSWAANTSAASKRKDSRWFGSKLDLVSRLYQHRLFPLWPSLRSGSYAKAGQELSRARIPELEPARSLLLWMGFRHVRATTDLVALIRGSWSDLLDPALAPPGAVLFESGKHAWSIRDVEERFSLSVKDGLGLVKRALAPLEVDLLADLARADEFLVGEDLPSNLSRYAKDIQEAIRQFSCRLVKRSIGVRQGVCRDVDDFQAFHAATSEPDGLREFKKQLQSLLHDDRGQFCSSLVTTFAQPVPDRARNVTLMAPRVPVKVLEAGQSDSRPLDTVPYITIKDHVIPVTFALFSALREVGRGMLHASLPGDIFALLDATKSIVTGQVIRDPNILSDEPRIRIGGCNEMLVLGSGRIDVEQAKE